MDGSAQGISAVSQSTAVALIQKAIKETNLENADNDQTPGEDKAGHARLMLEELNVSTPQEKPQEPPLLVTQSSLPLDRDNTSTTDTPPQTVREEGLAVLSSSAISTQVFSTPQQQHTSYEFHMHTPSSISTSLQGAATHSSGSSHNVYMYFIVSGKKPDNYSQTQSNTLYERS